MKNWKVALTLGILCCILSIAISIQFKTINDSNSTPKSLQQPVEDMIKEYVGFCNEGNYQAAFDMLSDDCKLYAFDDNIVNFMSHVYTKIPEPREYAIQSYSTVEYGGKQMYVYEVKYTQDLLATGLTDSEYGFTSENMTFTRGIEGMEMSVGNYIYHKDIKSISENEYLKIDIVDKVVNYSVETYKVKLTNRSNYTVVIADGQELNEVVLKLRNSFIKRLSQKIVNNILNLFSEIIYEPNDFIGISFIIICILSLMYNDYNKFNLLLKLN